MLFLTMKEWIGPKRDHTYPDGKEPMVRETVIGMATRMPLGQALHSVRKYELAYREKYPLAIEFTLIGVTEIADVSNGELIFGRVELVESMKLPVVAP
jgi:hypothetical protein